MEHTLLIYTKGSDAKKLTFSVHRGKKFNMPTDKAGMALVMDHEINGVALTFADLVEFWVNKGMGSREALCDVMIQFCKHVKGTPHSLIETVDAAEVARILPNIRTNG